MKAAHLEQLEEKASQLDRAIVRLGLKQPHALDRNDVAYVVDSMSAARDALRWVTKRSSSDDEDEEDALCEGGCGTTESQADLVGERHGRKLCENCVWEHDHGEEDCGWQCEEIPASLRKTHRKGKCGTHCPNPKTYASVPTGSAPR